MARQGRAPRHGALRGQGAVRPDRGARALSNRVAAGVARTIAEMVRMLHEHRVMHRDLKPENFLFANKKENSALKAIDFGLSMFFKPGEIISFSSYVELGIKFA